MVPMVGSGFERGSAKGMCVPLWLCLFSWPGGSWGSRHNRGRPARLQPQEGMRHEPQVWGVCLLERGAGVRSGDSSRKTRALLFVSLVSRHCELLIFNMFLGRTLWSLPAPCCVARTLGSHGGGCSDLPLRNNLWSSGQKCSDPVASSCPFRLHRGLRAEADGRASDRVWQRCWAWPSLPLPGWLTPQSCAGLYAPAQSCFLSPLSLTGVTRPAPCPPDSI